MLGLLASIGSGAPNSFATFSLIHDTVSIILHNQDSIVDSLSMGTSGPGGLVTRIVHNQITIILHGEFEWSLSFAHCARCPDGFVAFLKIVEDQVSIFLHIKAEPMVFTEDDSVILVAHGEAYIKLVHLNMVKDYYLQSRSCHCSRVGKIRLSWRTIAIHGPMGSRQVAIRPWRSGAHSKVCCRSIGGFLQSTTNFLLEVLVLVPFEPS